MPRLNWSTSLEGRWNTSRALVGGSTNVQYRWRVLRGTELSPPAGFTQIAKAPTYLRWAGSRCFEICRWMRLPPFVKVQVCVACERKGFCAMQPSGFSAILFTTGCAPRCLNRRILLDNCNHHALLAALGERIRMTLNWTGRAALGGNEALDARCSTRVKRSVWCRGVCRQCRQCAPKRRLRRGS